MKNKTTLAWIIGLLAVAGGLIGLSKILESAPPTGDTAASLTVASDDYVKGATSSPVVLIEYLDFECPSCAAYAPIVSQLTQEYGDRVTFVARYFPLPGHRNALPSAYAAEAAGRQGKFWEMHDILFARQSEWSGKPNVAAIIEGYAVELGLNMDQYRTDIASDTTKARVKRDMDSGIAAGVNATPTIYVNGEKLKLAGYETIKQALDARLAGGAE